MGFLSFQFTATGILLSVAEITTDEAEYQEMLRIIAERANQELQQAYDSERDSFKQWSDGVDALVQEVEAGKKKTRKAGVGSKSS